MSAGQGCRNLPTPGGAGGWLASPQRFPLGLVLVAGVAGRLKVAGHCGASLSLWDDVVNLSRWRHQSLTLAGLAQIAITLHHLLSQSAPWPAAPASTCPASRPALGLVSVLFAVAVLIPGGLVAQL